MVIRGTEAYQLLYCDDNGEVIGIDEVQLMEPIPADRLPKLRALLDDPEFFTVFEATKVLVAWRDEAGFASLEQILANDPRQGEVFVPHRLHGGDRFYDQLAEALWYGAPGPPDRYPDSPNAEQAEALNSRIIPLVPKLLDQYHIDAFDGNLKLLLNALSEPQLGGPTRTAIERTIAAGRASQASQLLPALAVMDPDLAWETIGLFDLDQPDRRIAQNVSTTTLIIDTEPARQLRERLASHPDESIREIVQFALEQWETRVR